MKKAYIKNTIQQKHSKGCLKNKTRNNRVIYKTQKEKYKEGIRAFRESLKDYRDFKGVNKETLNKYKEKYFKAFKRYPKRGMSIYDIKRALKEL